VSACGPRSSTWPTVSLLFFVFHFFFPQTTPPHPNHSSHLSPHTTLTVKAVCGERGAPAPPGKAIAIKIFDRVLPLETQVRGWMERGNGERERGGAPPAAFPPSLSLSRLTAHLTRTPHSNTHNLAGLTIRGRRGDGRAQPPAAGRQGAGAGHAVPGHRGRVGHARVAAGPAAVQDERVGREVKGLAPSPPPAAV
jgi:hypothetical protein